jgi:hypothetical protein
MSVAQVVERLPSKSEAMSSNLSTTKKKKSECASLLCNKLTFLEKTLYLAKRA